MHIGTFQIYLKTYTIKHLIRLLTTNNCYFFNLLWKVLQSFYSLYFVAFSMFWSVKHFCYSCVWKSAKWIKLSWVGLSAPAWMGKTALLTLCREEVGQYDQWGDEGAWQNDVYDVEERLSLDDQIERDLLILNVVWRIPRVDHLPGWTMDDGPLAILWWVETL